MYRWIILWMLFSISSQAQKVTIADEISIRNDFAYDILGKVGDNILLFRDRGMEYFINIYDDNLRFKREKELLFEKRKVRLHYIVPADSTFNAVYSYERNDTIYYKLRSYNDATVLEDSVTLDKVHKREFHGHYRFIHSEDLSKTALFAEEKNKILHLHIIDNIKKEEIWKASIELKNIELNDDFRKVVVSNQGLVTFLFEKNNSRFSKDDHVLHVISLYQATIVMNSVIEMKDRVTCDLEMAYNNINGNIVIAGLSSENSRNDATEYFFINKHITDYEQYETVTVRQVGLDFIAEVYGKKRGKEKELKNFEVYDLVLRQDGGFLLFTEMYKEYSRRTAFNSNTRIARQYGGSMRGWTDHYNEDIVIFAVHSDGNEHWRNILYKKQFSQDDAGVYSSFYILRTPSRLKLIYNDEIKNHNTVSEYVLNPLGDYERNSVLSTEYQNLKLRFVDAVQISPSQLLVPSEKNYNLRLVKVDYQIL